MKTKWTLLVVGSASGVVLATALAHSADLQPMLVTSVTGTLHIQQKLPCQGFADKTTPVTQGRLEITPAEGIDVAGGKFFALTRMNIAFAPFSVSGSCHGFGETRTYTAVSVQLGKSAQFTATAAGGGVFNVAIPKEDFLIYEGAIADGTFERGYKHPKEDVTGTIDFTLGVVTMHAVVGTTVHFEGGCVPLAGCAIKEDDDGTLTADLSGTIVLPDSDDDGVPDAHDNCRFVPNPNQVRIPTPVINPPPRVTLASCADGRIGTPSAADVCDGGAITLTNNAPQVFSLGGNVVAWEARDSQNRVATTTQNVTVIDTTPPIYSFIPPDFTLNSCGRVALGRPIATDDCAGRVIFTNNAPASFGVGTTPVTWTASDVSGNRTLATQMITVHDTVPPAVACTPAGNPNDDDRGRGNDRDRDGDRDRDNDRDDIDHGFFRVSSSDACSAAPIQLGHFTLAQGEIVKITRTRRPGVVHVGDVGRRHVRHFRVGPGENVIIAADGSGNIGGASCVAPHDHHRD